MAGSVTLLSQTRRAMLAQAKAAHPRECCGLLLGSDRAISGILPTANVHPTPLTHFEIDPQALIDAHRAQRKGGPAIVGYYHSHPAGAPDPSATDAAQASGDGRIWAIIAHDTVKFWQDTDGGFRLLSYSIAGG